MARKNARANDTTVATRRAARRRLWNQTEARGHRDHADTLPRLTTPPAATRTAITAN